MIARLILVLTAASALAPQGYRLERQPKVGDVSKMRVTAVIDMQGSSATFTSLMVEKVTAVETTGEYTLESQQTEAKVVYGVQTNTIPDGLPRSAVFLPNGELASLKADVTVPTEVRVSRMNGFISPGREIKVGDGWVHEYKATPQSGGVAGKAEFKVDSTEKLGEKTALVIKFVFRETSGERPAISIGKMWLDPERVRILKLESDWANAPMTGAPGPMNAKITVVREN